MAPGPYRIGFVSPLPSGNALAPERADTKITLDGPPESEEQLSCGGCGGQSGRWKSWRRPTHNYCWWLWEPTDQMWTFSCKDD
jgi:hypothetical protein